MKQFEKTSRLVMNLKAQSSRTALFGVSALVLLSTLLTQAAAFGASFDLQGQSKGSCSWISGNLRDWRDQDYIPCRVFITGRAVKDQTITITFPRMIGTKPGFENLLNFRASGNVTITSDPVLSSPTGAEWSYTLTIDYTGRGAGYVQFLARLAEGAHQNTGSSLMLSGKPYSMGKLQIHKPARSEITASGTASFGTRQDILRCLILPSAGFQIGFASLSNRLYCVQYSSDLVNWKTAQCVITGKPSWTQWVDKGQPETESDPATQAMRFYRLYQLPYVLTRDGDCRQDACGRDDDDRGCNRDGGHDRDGGCDGDRNCNHYGDRDHDRDCDRDCNRDGDHRHECDRTSDRNDGCDGDRDDGRDCDRNGDRD